MIGALVRDAVHAARYVRVYDVSRRAPIVPREGDMWSKRFQQPQKEGEPAHYFELEVTPGQKADLLSLLRGRALSPARLNELENLLFEARRIDAPLNRQRLDWAELEHEARRQGVSVVDIFWDRARRKDGT